MCLQIIWWIEAKRLRVVLMGSETFKEGTKKTENRAASWFAPRNVYSENNYSNTPLCS
jgi:hypothetical protein